MRLNLKVIVRTFTSLRFNQYLSQVQSFKVIAGRLRRLANGRPASQDQQRELLAKYHIDQWLSC